MAGSQRRCAAGSALGAARSGADGQLGEFRLIPRADIPQENIQRSGELKTFLGNTIQLAKNIWVERRDLRTQLNTASNIPNNYTYLQSTQRPQFRLEWSAEATPESLGVATTEISASVDVQNQQANIALNIPGTLDYTTTVENDVEVATITGGFSPTRVRSFRIENVSASDGDSQLILVDEGDIRGLIPRATIEVVLLTKQSASGLETPDYQRRHSEIFTISPTSTGLRNSDINVEGNRYTFNLGNSFRSWLKPNYDAAYEINIQQTTNSDAMYEQKETVEFQVSAGNA